MTPLQLEILLHYRYHLDDFREGDFSAPAVKGAMEWFISLELLVYDPRIEQGGRQSQYRLGAAGELFVDALCNVPLPVKRWVMPK
jgi:hypothetical protein